MFQRLRGFRMSIGWPEVVVLLIVAMGIGVTTLVVLILVAVIVRQRGRLTAHDAEDPDRDPDGQG